MVCHSDTNDQGMAASSFLPIFQLILLSEYEILF